LLHPRPLQNAESLPLADFYSGQQPDNLAASVVDYCSGVLTTVRHRTKRSKGCLSMATMELMVFKVIKEAEKTWLRLRGKNQLPKLITGVKFNDGVEQQNQHNQNAA